MPLSMYDASVPVFARTLRNLDRVLAKGEAYARERGADPDALLQSRLIFDMLPLVRQVQIATDMATRGASRLAGEETRSVEDNETTFAQLHARIAAALAHIEGFAPAQFVDSESRAITVKSRRGDLDFDGRSYLFEYVLPNLYFHATTAYNLLRQAGVAIGKADYLGVA
ncbi:DUF1993 domain-containing protein [Lysobacter solisilvae (ex Woo and Kim 2020)]|uniref:DUF1993 domain-containing protein n=1 Tax=Agrilutibacter terrestris TaxID=2865112 RepID=A0A7H0G062_9GAMM|nr:DUF1993 domain-containing protein [Lysobacter terrestris]QNP41678.1 DUF1993 domain-containing protein [Lysobacter terrestris]